ncbi:unnamed protein product [Caenorhabditis brenneri]
MLLISSVSSSMKVTLSQKLYFLSEISSLNHKNFRFCLILGDYESMDEFRDIAGMKVSPNSSHYSIPYSDNYLEFMFKDERVSDTPIDNTEQLMEQPNEDLSKVMEQLSVTADDSDKTSAPPKNLPDMPVDVVGLIIERSDYKEQLILRKVSKSLRTLVDKVKPSCKRLRVRNKADSITFYFDKTKVFYASPKSKLLDFYTEYKEDRSISLIVDDDYENIAFDDLAITFRNRKLHLEMLFFEYDDKSEYPFLVQDKYVKVSYLFESLWHKLSTKAVRFQITRSSDIREILTFLKPGVLESISIVYGNSVHFPETISYLAHRDQWKQAKELEVIFGFDNFPLENATHFKQFRIFEEKIGEHQLIRIIMPVGTKASAGRRSDF